MSEPPCICGHAAGKHPVRDDHPTARWACVDCNCMKYQILLNETPVSLLPRDFDYGGVGGVPGAKAHDATPEPTKPSRAAYYVNPNEPLQQGELGDMGFRLVYVETQIETMRKALAKINNLTFVDQRQIGETAAEALAEISRVAKEALGE